MSFNLTTPPFNDVLFSNLNYNMKCVVGNGLPPLTFALLISIVHLPWIKSPASQGVILSKGSSSKNLIHLVLHLAVEGKNENSPY